MSTPTLAIALERYDRHVPLFLGEIAPPDHWRYRALEVGMAQARRHGAERHRRMLRELEFDAAEVSLASYIIAKSRGVPLTAVPIFPRRLFSQNHIFVNVASGIRTPADLVGKRVGIQAFQVTMSVLAKGDLKSEYGVAWERIQWITQHAEEMEWSAEGLSIERAPQGADLAELLIAGEIDAYIHSRRFPLARQLAGGVRPLFDDAQAECLRYFRRHGHYPIMHLIALKEERVRELPDLPREMMGLCEAAKAVAQDYYQDPGYALLAFASNEYERQARELGPDLWPSGIKANRANLKRFIAYMVDQRLIAAPLAVESLFHPSVADT